MTSPFDWKNQPSRLVAELKHSEMKQRNAQRGGIKNAEQTTPRRFHVYSKAVQHAGSKTLA